MFSRNSMPRSILCHNP